MDLICHLWRSRTRGVMTLTADLWATLLRVKEDELRQIFSELLQHSICNIVRDRDSNVTVESRRILRYENDRLGAARRMRAYRERRNSDAVVTPEKLEARSQKLELREDTLAPWQERMGVFWRCYPKKKGKGNVEKWFKKHNPSPELVAQMVTAVQALLHTDDWQRERGQYIPHPATWLNAKGWEDEIQAMTSQRPTKVVL
jgi:hypothetical protein